MTALPPELDSFDGPDTSDPMVDLAADAAYADDRWAEFLMRHLVAAEDRVAAHARQRDEWLQPILDWFDRVVKADRGQIARITEALEHYAIAQRLASEDDRKTIVLPSGDIATRRQTEATVVVEDEKAVLSWALDPYRRERVVSDHPKLRLAELRKLVDIVPDADADAVVDIETGEFVPGLRVQHPTTTATVKPRHFS